MYKKTKGQIIEEIAESHTVEDIIDNVAKKEDDDLNDLAQDIYLDLLEKDEEKIQGLYERGQLRWFVVRMVLQNINSKNSPYYYKYKIRDKYRMTIDEYEQGNQPDPKGD